jgi:diadenosine tetraphosphate (Ap4A) HIT family hydrolase
MLIIPKRHVAAYFDLNLSEVTAMHDMLVEMKNAIETKDNSVNGFNIGVNVGKDAGQSIFHVHIHLIPRRKGDVKNPRGGVRGVIPGKQKY